MRRWTRVMLVCAALAALAGCATQANQKSAPAAAAAAPAPAGSKLAQVQLGMTKKQVKDILGPPTDENSYATGKVFIPFYFGNDARRASFFYKGIGRVVFADGNPFGGGGNEVIRVEYDPNESGTAR